MIEWEGGISHILSYKTDETTNIWEQLWLLNSAEECMALLTQSHLIFIPECVTGMFERWEGGHLNGR